VTDVETVAQGLAARGFTLRDARARASLLRQAHDGLRRLTGADAGWSWLVPGRLEVFGKHTDYCGGRTLVAALPRGFAIAAVARFDRVVRAYDARNDELCEIALAGADAPQGWRRYVAVTARRLAANFPGADLGVDVAFASDLPRAAGMSSSSALIIALANVLIRRGRLETREEWLSTIRSVEERVEYFGCVENGDGYRALIGTRGVGTEGGSEDHAAILMSRADHLSQFGFVPLRRLSEVALPSPWSFVIASSGVHADKAGTVRGRFNQAARAARAIVELWNTAAGTRSRSLAQALATSDDAGQRLREAIERSSSGDFTKADLLRRLDHFTREDRRLPEAVAAFAVGDAARLAELSAVSQADADALLGNQVIETNDLVAAARATGALAASSFGAGFGGSAWALVPVGDAGDFGPAWRDAYLSRHPSRVDGRWFAARPAPGILEVPTGA
jgi:galactokinase